MSEKPFAGQTVVVTGGGTGIGRATALAFADAGAAHVIVTGRRQSRLDQVGALSPAIVKVQADVRTEEGAEQVAQAVRSNGGKVDVLVHNAGIYRQTPVGEADIQLARDMVETNIIGPVLLTYWPPNRVTAR